MGRDFMLGEGGGQGILTPAKHLESMKTEKSPMSVPSCLSSLGFRGSAMS